MVEWPSEGISETRVEIDASVLRDAAAQAEELWEESRSPGPAAMTGWVATD